MRLYLSDIAERLGLVCEGSDVAVSRAALFGDAPDSAICLAIKPDYVARAERDGFPAVLTCLDVVTTLPCLRAEKPRVAFAHLLELFDDRPVAPSGIHPLAIVAQGARVDPTASIDVRAIVQEGAVIGQNTRIGPGAYIGHATRIGRDCVIGPSVVVHHRCTLGDRVRVNAGTVIGADGFGYEWDGVEHVRVPHLGTVVIEDDVGIGANCCVDRAKTGATRIGRGTKIDNLVQIAHGVHVGAFCLMAAQVGVAGSATLGDGVVMAGQSGIVDSATLGDRAIVAAQSGVMGDLPGEETYMGTPAREVSQMRRIIASTTRLPTVFIRLQALERGDTKD